MNISIATALLLVTMASVFPKPENFHIAESCELEGALSLTIVFDSPAKLRRKIIFDAEERVIIYRGSTDTDWNWSTGFSRIEIILIDEESLISVKLKNGSVKQIGEINDECRDKLVRFIGSKIEISVGGGQQVTAKAT